MASSKELLDKIIAWANNSKQIRCVILIGSQARSVQPADEYSDIDLILIVSDVEYFLRSDEWLGQIDKWYVTFVEPTAGSNWERRVLFDEARDVDFVIMSDHNLEELAGSQGAHSILSRGYEVLVDKSGVKNLFEENLDPQFSRNALPLESEFQNLVQDFWFHTVWTYKKLHRGELWVAKQCLDGYMKNRLLQILEFHAHAVNGTQYDTWHNGRLLEKWADPRATNAIPHTFANYSKDDMTRALLATMDIFHQFAGETAEILGYPYPSKAEAFVTEWIQHKCKEQAQDERGSYPQWR